MRGALVVISCAVVLAACATPHRTPAPVAIPWEQRRTDLQKLDSWQLDGRAAVAVGTQGWQAALNWRQRRDSAEIHLSGPLGIGALVLKRSPDGLTVNDAPPSEAALSQLRERLGFDPPIDHLRFWLLGVPDPSAAFVLTRNGQDRASQLIQDEWSIDYDRYMPAGGDLLPAHLTMTRADVRVRIAADRWEPK